MNNQSEGQMKKENVNPQLTEQDRVFLASIGVRMPSVDDEVHMIKTGFPG